MSKWVSQTQLAWNSNLYPVNMGTVQAYMKTSRWVFRVERELHFFNLTVADTTELSFTLLTASTALPFNRHTDATTPPPICSTSAAGKLNICRRQLQEGFQKLPKLQIYTSLPCASKGSVSTQAIQILTSAFCYILLRHRCNEDCFPKRQTSFVISSSFFFLCVRNSKLSSKMASQGWKNVTWL